jgi:RNA polymerase sigma-70 factor (ECF subfamily)
MQRIVPSAPSADEFVRLYTAASRRIYTYILTLLPDRTDAEDVFQEVSTVLWEKFREFTPGTQFGAWACKIAYFKAIKFRSLKAVRSRMFSEHTLENISAELEAMDDSLDVEYRLLAECFARLPAEERTLIEQRYRNNGSPRVIAETTGLPVRRIYKSLDRIRKALLSCVTRKMAEGGG